MQRYFFLVFCLQLIRIFVKKIYEVDFANILFTFNLQEGMGYIME
jgi:hypothetical protein